MTVVAAEVAHLPEHLHSVSLVAGICLSALCVLVYLTAKTDKVCTILDLIFTDEVLEAQRG